MFHPVYNCGFKTDPDPNTKGRELMDRPSQTFPRGEVAGFWTVTNS